MYLFNKCWRNYSSLISTKVEILCIYSIIEKTKKLLIENAIITEEELNEKKEEEILQIAKDNWLI